MTVERDAAPAQDALSAAEIRPERQGGARVRRLSDAERELYRWILREFAAATPPSGEATRTSAEALGLDAPDARLWRILSRRRRVAIVC